MPRVRFHKPGQYAHSNPKIRHQQVPAAQLEQTVNDDMLGQCVRYDWAEVVWDDEDEADPRKPAAGAGAQYDGELPEPASEPASDGDASDESGDGEADDGESEAASEPASEPTKAEKRRAKRRETAARKRAEKKAAEEAAALE